MILALGTRAWIAVLAALLWGIDAVFDGLAWVGCKLCWLLICLWTRD